jgi:ribosomal protein L11 methylase PrmA
MNIIDATRKHYNASGVHPTTDPDDLRSQFVVDRYRDHLRKLIQPGMRALDLGCNAGRLTFAMEDIEKHLLLQKLEEIEENRFVLVFCNKKGKGDM